MIPASEALQLNTAKLTDEERAAADRLEAMIEEQVRKSMAYRGVDIEGKETNRNVLAAVNFRLIAAGYNAQWQIVMDQHPLNRAIQNVVGFKLALSPSTEAYRSTLS